MSANSSRPPHPSRRRRLAAGLAAGLAVVAASGAALGGLTQTASAQSTVVAAIRITINPVGTNPAGLTGYRVDAICKGVAGLAAPGNQTLTGALGVAGGSVTLSLPVQAGTACQFRLIAQGTGPRPISGNSAFVGGIQRAVSFPVTVGGVAVDPNTVIETALVPVEASTDVVFGTLTPVTTSTTSTSTTSTTTTTTRPPTTLPATTVPLTTRALPAPTAPALTTARPVTPATKVITRVVVRDRKCRSGYRFSRSRCLTTAERKKYVK